MKKTVIKGIFTALIVVVLCFSPASVSAQTPEFLTENLKLDSSGDEVTLLQTWLSQDSDIYPEAVINGTYGPATERAVKRYQVEKGMILKNTWSNSSYGAVGPMTRANLNAEFSKNQGGISSVEALYGDALVYEKGVFISQDEKQYEVNVPVTKRLNMWVNVSALSEREMPAFADAEGYAVGVKENGKIFVASPNGKGVTLETYVEPLEWQHIAVIFTKKDAVIIHNNALTETIPLVLAEEKNFFEKIFGDILESFKILSISSSVPDSKFTSAPAKAEPVTDTTKPKGGIFDGAISFVVNLFGLSSREQKTSAVPPKIEVTYFIPTTTTPIKIVAPTLPLFPMPAKPVLIPSSGTTTVVTVVSSTTPPLVTGSTTPSSTSSTTPPLAFGSTTPTTATSTATSAPSVISFGGGSGGAGSNHAPVITLSGSASVSIPIGTVYTDPGATAQDTEDGNITANIVVGGSSVNHNIPGDYQITYNIRDSSGASATAVTRTVTVTPPASVPISQQTPTYALGPAGENVSYGVSSGESVDPVFVHVDINPLHVYVGQTQTLTVRASSASGVSSVTAVSQLDTTTLTLQLTKQSEADGIATFSTSWVVYDTHVRTYRTTFTATNGNGGTNAMTMAWSDPCSTVGPGSQGADGTLSVNCTVSAVYGLDGGTLTINNGITLTINNGGTWAWNPGKSILVNGQIVKGSGGLLKKGYLFYLDCNECVDTSTMYFFTSTPQTGYTRAASYSQSYYQSYYESSYVPFLTMIP
jgi:hypothetical protein